MLISLLLLPLSVAMFEAVHELPCVAAPIFPLVLAEAFWLAVAVLAHVAVSVRKEVGPVAVAQALEPLSFILIAVSKDMDSVALRLRVHPLADIRLTIGAFPDTVAMLDSFQPLAVVDFSVFPLINTLAVRFAIFVGAMVGVTVGEDFEAAAMTLVLEPFSFVDAAVLVDEHTEALSLPRVVQLAPIDAIFVLLNAEIGPFPDLLEVKLVANHFVPLNCVTFVFKCTFLLARWSESLLQHLVPDLIRYTFLPCHGFSCLCHIVGGILN